jgi:phage portal protein BeeE
MNTRAQSERAQTCDETGQANQFSWAIYQVVKHEASMNLKNELLKLHVN